MKRKENDVESIEEVRVGKKKKIEDYKWWCER